MTSVLWPVQGWSQTFGDVGRMLEDAGRPGSAVRVTAMFQISTPPAASATLDDQTIAIATAHKILYGLAARECELLVESFNMDCRMTQLMVNDLNGNLRNQPGLMAWTASAAFELRPKPASAARP